MNQKKIERISELTQLSRERELTPREMVEREMLRKEYIADHKRSLENQLKNIRLIDEKGNKRALHKRGDDL